MKNKNNANIKEKPSDDVIADLVEEFVWGTTAEAKQDAATLYLIHAIAEKYHGKAKVDTASKAIKIDVPEEKKMACLAEIEEKTGMIFQ